MKPTHLAHLLILISIWSCHTSLLLELYKIIHMQWWEPEVSISLVVLKIVTSNTIWSILNLVLKKLGRGKIPTHPPHRRPAPLPSTPPPPHSPPHGLHRHCTKVKLLGCWPRNTLKAALDVPSSAQNTCLQSCVSRWKQIRWLHV